MPGPDVLIFDLFGTLVFFDDSRVPTMEVAGRRVPMTVAGLPGLLCEFLPGGDLLGFLRELRRVSADIADRKRREGIEIATAVRFETTLRALGATPAAAAAGASRMAALHMDTLARAVVCPPGRAELLRRLARSYRLALLSNFDDGVTARRVLAEAGIASYFDVIVISEEEGLRKPSRELFERTCTRLAVPASDCLYIGDTLVEDIEGATGAGLSALWVRSAAARDTAPDAAVASPAAGIIEDVDALPAWLAGR
ncbi:MAG: HAD family hydrolase [Candidatus Binatia bacterium]